jgi:hypothetical protein
LENARNLHFVHSLGLKTGLSEIRSALPGASERDLVRLRGWFQSVLDAPVVTPDVLEKIASHQYVGVRTTFEVATPLKAISLTGSYNNAQQ